MKAVLANLPDELSGTVTEALAQIGVEGVSAETAPAAPLWIFYAPDAETAKAELARIAPPPAAKVGQDLRAQVLAIWLMPAGSATTLAGVLQAEALAHAPDLRLNALHMGSRRPEPAPWQSAWEPSQPHPAQLERAESLAQALSFLSVATSVMGQILHLNSP
ncbi:hypothetical protein C8J27_10372 [Rhodobacter aestuarii]|uniref:Uncharacterized protein n=1 Tax=Rhodobacter aestuarii TaxID=453582 RepID=A0A1N7KDK8_9RHOB|nr:hypothetical protein [Rhodobacter aestuarii]PTV95744.1 hypothetical protein C8J27_10372 [Rhodobacter aestuarii]SIS59697.1 hypothetical protein SAMN05421580_102362 [Rhodobacter aestuarii]